jgi:hypothetical protein
MKSGAAAQIRRAAGALRRRESPLRETVMIPALMREAPPMAMIPDALLGFLAELEGMGIDHAIVPIVDRAGLDVLLEEIVPMTRLVHMEG